MNHKTPLKWDIRKSKQKTKKWSNMFILCNHSPHAATLLSSWARHPVTLGRFRICTCRCGSETHRKWAVIITHRIHVWPFLYKFNISNSCWELAFDFNSPIDDVWCFRFQIIAMVQTFSHYVKYTWTFQFGCLTWFRYRVSIHHSLGFNWHLFEGAGSSIPNRFYYWFQVTPIHA